MIVNRRATRVLLIADDALLLIRGRDPSRPERGEWWLTPGGGVEDGESLRDAAAREVREETGLQIAAGDFGPVVATQDSEFVFERTHFHQTNFFFALEVDHFTPDVGGWDVLEQRALLELRWWRIEDLEKTDETLYPSQLAALVHALSAGTIDEPMQLKAP